jgi:hypothetical protein
MSVLVASWLADAAQPVIVRRALATSVVVGTLLTLVNHGRTIVDHGWSAELLWPIVLTFLTPYVVASISAAATIRAARAKPVDQIGAASRASAASARGTSSPATVRASLNEAAADGRSPRRS